MRWLNKHFPQFNAKAGMTYRVLRLYASNGSRQAWGRFLRHVARGTNARPVPVFFAVGLTYRCTCRCEHCYAAGREHRILDELKTDEVKGLLRQAAELGTLEAFFTGGEALLRPDLSELIVHARSLGMLTRLSTNGYLLDQKHVDALAAAGLTQAGVSIDYADPEEHDRFRGLPGLHERAVQGIRRLLDAGIRVQVHCLATRQNITEGLERIIALAKDLGASGVCMIFPSASGRLESDRGEILTEEERAAVRALQDFSFAYAELPTPQTICTASGCAFLYVNPDGYVSPCTTIRYTMGNVRQMPLGEIWERYTEGMNIPCYGRCILNEPELHDALRDYMAEIEAMKDR